MLVSAKGFDQIRQAITDGQNANALAERVSAFTVDGAFECCCANWFWENEHNLNGLRFFEEVQSRFSPLKLISNALRKGWQPSRNGNIFTPFSAELYTVQGIEDFSNENFGLFQMRFSRSLGKNGFGKELGRAIAAALGEMADNIVQHANLLSQAHGLVAYKVVPRAACFVVADTGQGVLKSLTQVLKWKSLQTDREALLAAICKGATSRPSANTGMGFQQVHKALAACNGSLRFHSGKSVLTLSGASDPKTAITESVIGMGGFQLSVCCDLDNKGEKFLVYSFM